MVAQHRLGRPRGERPPVGVEHRITPTLGHQRAEPEASQCPEEVPTGLRDVLVTPTVLRAESPSEFGILEPLHQRRAIALGLVEIEVFGDPWVLEEFLHVVERQTALEAFEQLDHRRGERRKPPRTATRPTERQTPVEPQVECGLDQGRLLARVGQQDQDLFVTQTLQFVEGLDDAIAADLEFAQRGVGGMDGQRRIVGRQGAPRFRGQGGRRSAGGLQAPQQGVRRLGAVEVDPAGPDGEIRVGPLALEVLGRAPQGPQESTRLRGRRILLRRSAQPARLDRQVGPVITAGSHGEQVDPLGGLSAERLQQLGQASEQHGRQTGIEQDPQVRNPPPWTATNPSIAPPTS